MLKEMYRDFINFYVGKDLEQSYIMRKFGWNASRKSREEVFVLEKILEILVCGEKCHQSVKSSSFLLSDKGS